MDLVERNDINDSEQAKRFLVEIEQNSSEVANPVSFSETVHSEYRVSQCRRELSSINSPTIALSNHNEGLHCNGKLNSIELRSSQGLSSLARKCRTPSPQSYKYKLHNDLHLELAINEEKQNSNCSSVSEGQLESKIEILTMAVDRYKKELRKRDARIAELDAIAAERQAIMEAYHGQKIALFEKFCMLRNKYDKVKSHLKEVLWEYMPSCRIPGVENRGPPWLEAIPEINKGICEDNDRVGPYILEEVLGEGQFASVRVARHQDVTKQDKKLAVKVIDKNGVVNVTTLRRVDHEIASLQRLHHPGIMKIHDVIHAPNCVYMITDRAGRDLFEFFDSHLEGVSESIAAQLLAKIMDPVAYCHSQGICHRDLKPENILFSDREPFSPATRIVLCDFGLCSRVETEEEEKKLIENQSMPNPLHEFCGSPGFFAPEMLVCGMYDGKKADAWSLGSILLELVLGHEDFCRIWMSAYEYKYLKNATLFDEAIQESCKCLKRELPSRLSYQLVDFLLVSLHLDPSKRMSVAEMLSHPWITHHVPPGWVPNNSTRMHKPRRDLTIDVMQCSNNFDETEEALQTDSIEDRSSQSCEKPLNNGFNFNINPQSNAYIDDQPMQHYHLKPALGNNQIGQNNELSWSMSQRTKLLLPNGFSVPPDSPGTPSVRAVQKQFIYTTDQTRRASMEHRSFTSSQLNTTRTGILSPSGSPVFTPFKAFFKGKSGNGLFATKRFSSG